MSDEVRFTLRLPIELAERIRELAECSERSVHQQVIYILKQATKRAGREKAK